MQYSKRCPLDDTRDDERSCPGHHRHTPSERAEHTDRVKHLRIDSSWYTGNIHTTPPIISQTRRKMDGAIPIADAQSVESLSLKTDLIL